MTQITIDDGARIRHRVTTWFPYLNDREPRVRLKAQVRDLERHHQAGSSTAPRGRVIHLDPARGSTSNPAGEVNTVRLEGV